MAGLFALLWGAIVGGAAIGEKIEDSKCKQNVYTLPNGIRYYFDRKGKQRLMDGTLILAFGDGDYKTIDGRILYSRNAEENRIAVSKVTHNKYRYATQRNHPRCEGFATVELSTGKIVAKVAEHKKRDGSYEYRKWYFKDLYPDKSDKEIQVYSRPTSTFFDIRDEGIVISAEEFNAINSCATLPGYENTRAHDLFISDDPKMGEYAVYSEPWHRALFVVREEDELANEFVKSGKEDGWYSFTQQTELYVKKGYVIKRRRKDINGNFVEEYPYTRKPGDRWYSVKMSYTSHCKRHINSFEWFEYEPTNKEYESLDQYKYNRQ